SEILWQTPACAGHRHAAPPADRSTVQRRRGAVDDVRAPRGNGTAVVPGLEGDSRSLRRFASHGRELRRADGLTGTTRGRSFRESAFFSNSLVHQQPIRERAADQEESAQNEGRSK